MLSFYNKIRSQTASIIYARRLKLLPLERPNRCVDCNTLGSVKCVRTSSDGPIPYHYRCSSCGKRTSVAVGTWFHRSHLSVAQNIVMLRQFSDRLLCPGLTINYMSQNVGVSITSFD